MKCEACRSDRRIEQHRILPGTRGGRYTHDNVVNLCSRCHAEIHVMIRAAFGYRYKDKRDAGLDDFLIILNKLKHKYRIKNPYRYQHIVRT